MIGNASPEAFYRLTVTENVFASIDTCGSALDTLLRIGSLAGSRYNETLAINDNHDGEGPDNCGDTDSSCAVALSPGDYIIIVEAFSGPFAASTVGEFTLSIECTDCASQPRLCVPPTPTAASECDAAPSHEGCTDTEYCGAAQQCYPCTQCALFNDQGCAERCAEPTTSAASTVPSETDCSAHADCDADNGGGLYCDLFGTCWSCSSCLEYHDAIDDTCPCSDDHGDATTTTAGPPPPTDSPTSASRIVCERNRDCGTSEYCAHYEDDSSGAFCAPCSGCEGGLADGSVLPVGGGTACPYKCTNGGDGGGGGMGSVDTASPATTGPTAASTQFPSSSLPTGLPASSEPTARPSPAPTTGAPTPSPTVPPSTTPTTMPTSSEPSNAPSGRPTSSTPSTAPSTTTPTQAGETMSPTSAPTSTAPTPLPTGPPASSGPTLAPTRAPQTDAPTSAPSSAPTTLDPTPLPTPAPTSVSPTLSPAGLPTQAPTVRPTPTVATATSSSATPIISPTWSPTLTPSTGEGVTESRADSRDPWGDDDASTSDASSDSETNTFGSTKVIGVTTVGVILIICCGCCYRRRRMRQRNGAGDGGMPHSSLQINNPVFAAKRPTSGRVDRRSTDLLAPAQPTPALQASSDGTMLRQNTDWGDLSQPEGRPVSTGPRVSYETTSC